MPVRTENKSVVKAMEDYKNEFVLILAGYPDEMENFLSLNPGLPSRFPLKVEFPDYTVDELLQITELMVKDREYCLSELTVQKLKQHLIQATMNEYPSFSNARYVRNLLEKAVRNQAVRLLKHYAKCPGKQELMLLRPEDFTTYKAPDC